MDEIAKYNRERWEALAQAGALFTRPLDNLDAAAAREMVDPDGGLGDLNGKRVLCLAGGGGRQSVAFGLLGADVTVVDLSDEQLERDRQMEQHYGLNFSLHQGDMRDLAMLAADAFDIAHQPYSLNFVPDAPVVFAEVARVIRRGGVYDFMCANPFAAGVTERDWNGDGYTIKRPYVQGERVAYEDQAWVYDRDTHAEIAPPVEYRQTLSALVGGLTANGFIITQLREEKALSASFDAPPGTWDHFTAVLPPWFTIRAVYRPDLFVAEE